MSDKEITITAHKPIVVDFDKDAEAAFNVMVDVARHRKEVEEEFSEKVSTLYEPYKKALAERKEATKPLVEAEEVLRKAASEWLEEQMLLAERAIEDGDPPSEILPESVQNHISIKTKMSPVVNDLEDFVQWCIENERLDLLSVNEKAVVKEAEKRGPLFDPDGVTIKTTFSPIIYTGGKKR